MIRALTIAAVALACATQIAVADNPPPAPKPDPGSTGDKDKGQGFTWQQIAPLRDGSNYWPGYLLVQAASDGGEVKACYIIAPSASIGDSKIVVPSGQQVYLLCSNPEHVGKSPDSK